MQKVKCYDLVGDLILEGSKQFSPFFVLNEENLKILTQYCHVIDLLCEEFDGESYEVEVDEIQLTIHISLECHQIICNHRYLLALKERSLDFQLQQNPKEELFRITFVSPPIWDRINRNELFKKYFKNIF